MTGRLVAPTKMGEVPENAQWLSGEGGGAWFSIEKKTSCLRIKRYTPQGILDCDREFVSPANGNQFDENLPFEVQHISHCARVKVIQGKETFVFEVIEK